MQPPALPDSVEGLRAASGRVQRFAILAEGRSGSNWLADLLRSHPACVCLGEIFLPPAPQRALEDPTGYLEACLRKAAARPGCTHVGFKHLPSFEPAVARHVVADPRYKVIFLTRRDKLAQYASLQIALATRRWALTGGGEPVGEQARVPFVARDFLDFCRRKESWFRPERKALRRAGRPGLEVTYEELEAGAGLPRVLAFLGLPAAGELHSRHQRLNTSDVYDRFENPRQARRLGPLIAARPTRKLVRILRGIRPLRPLVD